ncbi:MAG: TfoX/Sxy family protein [Ginsengibacter sp.]
MAYNVNLANRIREHLLEFSKLKIEEKKMFSGLAFLVNGKMCINVSNDNLMCRFDPALHEEVAEKNGFLPMIMKGRELKGYCYVSQEGFKKKKDFEYWINLCLDFNEIAKASKKRKSR